MAVVRYYGAKPDKPDDRDYRKKYQEHEIPSMWTHPNVDLSVYVKHVYDQEKLQSCTANALCAAYGLDLVKQSQTTTGGYFNPSRLFLYYNTRKREGTQSKNIGTSIRDAVKSMNREGVCKESDWPYIIRRFKEKPPRSCYDAATGNNLCKYERLDQDIDQFRACLKDNCPFVFGFKVYRSFDDTKNGYMPMPSARELRQGPDGRHAVVAVGYDDFGTQARGYSPSGRYFKVLNSWGPRWGDNGYFYMPYEFISNSSFCFDFWKISFACEQGRSRPKDSVPRDGIGSLLNMGETSGGASHYNFLGLDLSLPPPSVHSNGASRYDGFHDPTELSRSFEAYGYPRQSRVNHRANHRNYDYDGDEFSRERYR